MVLICSNTCEQLTRWMCNPSDQRFQSAQTPEHNSLPVQPQPFLSVILIYSLESNSQTGWGCSNSLALHPFLSVPSQPLSVILICSNTQEQPTTWMGVQPFSSMVLLKHWKVTHFLSLYGWSILLVSGSKSAQTLENDSPAGCMINTSRQRFQSAQHYRATYCLDVCSCQHF